VPEPSTCFHELRKLASRHHVPGDLFTWLLNADDNLNYPLAGRRDRRAIAECVAYIIDATGSGKPMPRIVCLCGSTRFYEAFQRANYEETIAGHIVLSVGFYMHASTGGDTPWGIGKVHGENVGCTPEQKVQLDELHKRKIDLADEVFVLNVDGYIGDSTRSEIEYAEKHGVPVRYLEAPADCVCDETSFRNCPVHQNAGDDTPKSDASTLGQQCLHCDEDAVHLTGSSRRLDGKRITYTVICGHCDWVANAVVEEGVPEQGKPATEPTLTNAANGADHARTTETDIQPFELQRILDDVDARDSLAYRETLSDPENGTAPEPAAATNQPKCFEQWRIACQGQVPSLGLSGGRRPGHNFTQAEIYAGLSCLEQIATAAPFAPRWVKWDINRQGELTLWDVFNGIGIKTDQGLIGIAQRDSGIEVILTTPSGKRSWSSTEAWGNDPQSDKAVAQPPERSEVAAAFREWQLRIGNKREVGLVLRGEATHDTAPVACNTTADLLDKLADVSPAHFNGLVVPQNIEEAIEAFQQAYHEDSGVVRPTYGPTAFPNVRSKMLNLLATTTLHPLQPIAAILEEAYLVSVCLLRQTDSVALKHRGRHLSDLFAKLPRQTFWMSPETT
jgi:hypothetical protein